MADDATLFRTSEVAEKLAISEQMVRILIRRGDLKSVRIGKALRVSREDLDAYVDRLRKKGI